MIDCEEYTGRFEAQRGVTIQARASGHLHEIHFADGQPVKAGDPLFTIDPKPFRPATERARASPEAARAALDLSEVERDHARQLADRNVGTVQDPDQARAEYAQALAQVSLAEAELDLGHTQAHTPIAGRSSAAEVDPGAPIVGGPAGATTLTEIVTVDPIEFVFTASEAGYLRCARLAERGTREASRTAPNRILVRPSTRTGGTARGGWTSSTTASTPTPARSAAARSSTTPTGSRSPAYSAGGA